MKPLLIDQDQPKSHRCTKRIRKGSSLVLAFLLTLSLFPVVPLMAFANEHVQEEVVANEFSEYNEALG